ncbi:hypothetical protein sscle_12g089940 [Sclerotinia sclerotiorum 1980 UF-70]|uniref:NADH:flavin oxidoreductase/NADH oxidase N-terminal domain-containing protein n=1 Tax=Sclerotinia sclerotiorum (strain ATCC 18683 / 1980 / Ss-1) TaxID=665079 RepID=A0A1D9QH14_SCLS1|nr:hypothetical protein sscle_12g089940 [Sclerotinia sclerotiorum 1980 UF-70]
MILAESTTLPCGLSLPNRICKGAMAETMSTTHIPDESFLKAYGAWADGGWGMIITGNVQVSTKYLGNDKDVAHNSNPTEATKAIWKSWAATCQRSGTPTIVQICHPGRQSPLMAGDRGFFEKTVAPSAVPLRLGKSLIERAASKLIFGTPRELTINDITGPGGIIDEFVVGAKQCYEAGFKGVEIHGAHGYLLAQFLSPSSNIRTDEFGGTAKKRAEIVVRIINAIRKQTSKEFCIGIKMNSVDASSNESLTDSMEQIQCVVEAGIDFIEISGGTYENPRMMEGDAPTKKSSTSSRESFFLEFAKSVREQFPSVVLMVTGGFRTRIGMEDALQSGACDLVGMARPAAIMPKLPKEIILNKDIPDEEARVTLAPLAIPFLIRHSPIKQVGAGFQSTFFASQIQRLSKGLTPENIRA